jgi:predicted transcriptional regulator
MPDVRGKYYPPLEVVRTVEGSVTHERIYCLFDNQPVINLRKHLLIRYNMLFDEYLEFCGLPEDYPSVPERTREIKEQVMHRMAGLRAEETASPSMSLADWPKRTRQRLERTRAH